MYLTTTLTSIVGFFLVSSLMKATAAATAYDPSAVIGDITKDQTAKAAPLSNTCKNTDGTPLEEECTSADDATRLINGAFSKYQIKSLGEKAALLSTMAYESMDFLYNINVDPSRPGQGTKAMLMWPSLYKYAASQFPTVPPIDASALDATLDETKNGIRKFVLTDDYTFGAAPWYLVMLCPDTVDTLKNDVANGFERYLSDECVGLYPSGDPVPIDRLDKWCTTVRALLPVGMEAPAGC